MASLAKYRLNMIDKVFSHNNRKPNDDVKRKNESINPELTHLNRNIKIGGRQLLEERLNEVFYVPRKDTVVMCEVCVTLPESMKRATKEEIDLFFNATYQFFVMDFGLNNVINAVVHNDETTPHLHLDFVPVVKGDVEFSENSPFKKPLDKWKKEHEEYELERLCCYEVLTRDYLENLHIRLSKYLEGVLGHKVEILNGATAQGNKKILELKVESLKKELALLENQRGAIKDDITEMINLCNNFEIKPEDLSLMSLVEMVADLKNRNHILMDMVRKNGLTFTKAELNAIKDKRYNAAESASMSIMTGSLCDCKDFENDAIIVITYPANSGSLEETMRNSAQSELIDKDDEAYRSARMAISNKSPSPIFTRPARNSDRLYMFIRIDDDIHKLFATLLEFEKQLKSNYEYRRRVYIDKIESDQYDVLQSILKRNNIYCQYFIKLNEDNEKEQEKTLEKA